MGTRDKPREHQQRKASQRLEHQGLIAIARQCTVSKPRNSVSLAYSSNTKGLRFCRRPVLCVRHPERPSKPMGTRTQPDAGGQLRDKQGKRRPAKINNGMANTTVGKHSRKAITKWRHEVRQSSEGHQGAPQQRQHQPPSEAHKDWAHGRWSHEMETTHEKRNAT